MKSVAARMKTARSKLMGAIGQISKENELPAYIMESIIGDVLGDVRQSSSIEMLSEIDREDKGED